MSDDIKEYHEKVNASFKIPEWALIDCPFCKNKIQHSGVRNIGLCLNSRNLGDISVEFHCDECVRMDTVYFRREINYSVAEFRAFLIGAYKPSNPVVEEEMYQLKYNNLIERMIGESQNVDD